MDLLPLLWGDEDDISKVMKSYPTGFDMIIGSDLLYNSASFPGLLHTLKKLTDNRPQTEIYIAFVDRLVHKKFFHEAEECFKITNGPAKNDLKVSILDRIVKLTFNILCFTYQYIGQRKIVMILLKENATV